MHVPPSHTSALCVGNVVIEPEPISPERGAAGKKRRGNDVSIFVFSFFFFVFGKESPNAPKRTTCAMGLKQPTRLCTGNRGAGPIHHPPSRVQQVADPCKASAGRNMSRRAGGNTAIGASTASPVGCRESGE
jgi:hypothetical protein